MTEEQLELIEEKYGKLIHKIGHYISGDYAISGHSDNVQDIWVAAIEAIRGYEKKENQTFNEFWGSKGFDKYLKTCLWNVKNGKGAKITKRYPITKHTVSLSKSEEVFQVEDDGFRFPDLEIFIEELGGKLNHQEAALVSNIVYDPSMFKESGKINVSSLARESGLSNYEVTKHLKSIENKIGNDL
jgi:hypothetical protein